MSDQYTLLLGFPPFRITFGNLKLRLLDSLFSTSEDKAKWQRTNYLQETVGKIVLKFYIFFINLVRTLHTVPHNNFGVNLIQTTKCSQEGKVWLIVVVFQFIVLQLCQQLESHYSSFPCLNRSQCTCKYYFNFVQNKPQVTLHKSVKTCTKIAVRWHTKWSVRIHSGVGCAHDGLPMQENQYEPPQLKVGSV